MRLLSKGVVISNGAVGVETVLEGYRFFIPFPFFWGGINFFVAFFGVQIFLLHFQRGGVRIIFLLFCFLSGFYSRF